MRCKERKAKSCEKAMIGILKGSIELWSLVNGGRYHLDFGWYQSIL
jgi:hypothetical protein